MNAAMHTIHDAQGMPADLRWFYRIVFRIVFLTGLLALPPTVFAASIPPLDANAWNIVFVPSFEPNPSTNTLSVEGFNHALRFGQLLDTATAGKERQVRQIMAFTANAQPNDITPLQSIEPYAVLNNRAVSQTIVASGDITQYNSPSYIIAGILAGQPQGDYVVSMPLAMINDTIANLLGPGSGYNGITSRHQYVVLSLEQGRKTTAVYTDGIAAETRMPSVDLQSAHAAACPQKPTTFTVKRPTSSFFALNTGQTVYMVRHVEAHPNNTFENGNYVCQGAWRALGAGNALERMMGHPPKTLFTTNPNDIIGCDGTCSYIRPTLTIAPYAVQHGMPLKLAGFQWNDPRSLAASLFTHNTPYSDPAFDRSQTLVAWEHGNLVKAVQYLVADVYGAPDAAKKIPDWSFTDYDSVWTLQTDADGNLTFSNSCEHIDSDALPSTCPAFPGGVQ